MNSSPSLCSQSFFRVDSSRINLCGGVLVVLGTRLLSGSAHGCCVLASRKVKSRRKCWKLKMMKRRKVKWMAKLKRESVNVCMRRDEWGTNSRHLSHNVMCKESNEDDTEETLQTNKQRALSSLQVLFSWVCTCFKFASTLNMLLCLLFCFVSLIQSSSVFPRIHFSLVCEFLVIPCNCSHRENGSFEVLSLHLPSVTADRRQL